MKKICKSTKKGKLAKKVAKVTQKKLNDHLAALERATECHTCNQKFDKTSLDNLDWQVRVDPFCEVTLTCTKCIAESNKDQD